MDSVKLFRQYSQLSALILQIGPIFALLVLCLSGGFVSAKPLVVWKPIATDSGLFLQGVLSETPAQSTMQFRIRTETVSELIPVAVDTTVGEYRYLAANAQSPTSDSCVISLEMTVNGQLVHADTLQYDLLNPDQPSSFTLPASVTQAMPQDRGPGVTLNGVIAPENLPTRYYFEYGTQGVLDRTTEILPLGGALHAVYEENFESAFSGLMMPPGFELETGLDPSQGKVAVPSTYPTFQDFNHRSGIGTIFLTMFGYTSDTLRGFGDLALGGGTTDFRDAIVSVKTKLEHFHANGSKMRFWVQSLADGDFGDGTWVRANWYAESSSLLPDSNGTWQTVRTTLRNNAQDWIYAGTDLTQPRYNRYAYWPLDSTLGRMDTDFLLTLSAIDPSNPPTGEIYFDDLSITYRNSNLLTPMNGATLISGPISLHDPSTLTDGRRVGESHCWSSSSVDTNGHIFLYQFDSLIAIDKILFAQHPSLPTHSFRCALSVDGITYQDVWSGMMDSTKNASAHLNFERVILNREPARFIRIELLNGYQEVFGLGEIEVYGSGAALNPGSDSCYVNADISGFAAGEMITYRLVAENALGRYYGSIQSCMIPADSAPMTITEGFEVIDQVSARVRVTAQGRGKSGNVWVQFRESGDSLWRSTSQIIVAAHPNQFASHHWFNLDSLPSGESIAYRSIFESTNGTDTGRVEYFTTPPNHTPTLVNSWNPSWQFSDSIEFSLAAIDQDASEFGDVVSVAVISAPSWMTADLTAGRLFGKIPFEANCRDSVRLLLSDNKGGVDTVTQEIEIAPLPSPVLRSLADGDILQVAMPIYSHLIGWSPGLSSPLDSFSLGVAVNGLVQEFPLSDTLIGIPLMSSLVPGGEAALWINRYSPVSCHAIVDTIRVTVSPIIQQAVQATTSQLSFGDASRGSARFLHFDLSNAGSEEFAIDSVTRFGPVHPAFDWMIDNPTVIPVDQITQVSCGFRPQSLGYAADSVKIWTRGGVVTLIASGNSPHAAPVVASNLIDFGSQFPDSVQMKSIEIQKNGLNSLRVISVEGLDEPFVVNSEVVPVDILDSNMALIPVTFVPQYPGEYLDTLTIQTNGIPSVVSVVVRGMVTVATGTEEELHTLPKSFALHQNYPNPFNPRTTVSYDLPHRSNVSLKILNLLGQEVDQLVQSEQAAGSYSTEWEGKVASGVYFAVIQVTETVSGQTYSQVKKMLRIE